MWRSNLEVNYMYAKCQIQLSINYRPSDSKTNNFVGTPGTDLLKRQMSK
jgi:hypothetical protein